MSTSPTRAFLISFDNGEDYEDHHRSPRFLVPTLATANRIIADVDEWLARERPLLPPDPMDEWGENPEMSDEKFAEMNKRREAHINALKPPYGLNDMAQVLDENGYGSHGHLVITELPYLQEDTQGIAK